jgi:hypothetical protein
MRFKGLPWLTMAPPGLIDHPDTHGGPWIIWPYGQLILIQRRCVRPASRLPIHQPSVAALVLALSWGPPNAVADPLVTIATTSDCPSSNQLDTEIGQWSLPSARQDGARWHAVVDHPNASTARLRLYAQDGALALQRTIQSDDCEALAKAFAIILETHFLDLGLVLPRPVAPAADEPPAPQPQLPSEPKPQSDSKPKTPPPAKAPAKDQVVAPTSRLRLALGLGAQWALPEPGLTGAGRGLVGLSWRSEWCVQLGLTAVLPQTQEGVASNDRVDSQAFGAVLGLARRLRADTTGQPTVWLEPHLGLGARFSRLTAEEVSGEKEVSVRVLGELGLATGLQLGPNWSPRLDVVGHLLLDRDRYIIDPHGAVGRGPRAVLFATIGGEFTGL